jgi:tRNA nucleotidyltransferase (CCA-adding enzyme)
LVWCIQLLGLQSHDIDVALTDMMGVTFAEQFQQYCRSVKGVPVDKISKVERNPDRSKHLETAKATVLDIELDFVNLRSEEYAADSRIPTQIVSTLLNQSHLFVLTCHQAFGTPLEDALRRDITINALFYNVHSRAVEDHTEKVSPALLWTASC